MISLCEPSYRFRKCLTMVSSKLVRSFRLFYRILHKNVYRLFALR